jgi:hypothetical protein
MSKYRINPAGVKTVLKATEEDAKKFEGIFKPLNGYVETAVTAAYDMGPLGAALQTFFAEQGKGLEVIGTRVGNGIAGAALATKAYIDGDDDMAQKIKSLQSKAAGLTLAAELQRKQSHDKGQGGHQKGPR